MSSMEQDVERLKTDMQLVLLWKVEQTEKMNEVLKIEGENKVLLKAIHGKMDILIRHDVYIKILATLVFGYAAWSMKGAV